jgi:hypothetical protein
MGEPQKLGEIISELMALFRRRRELESWIREGTASAIDHAELEALNRRLNE